MINKANLNLIYIKYKTNVTNAIYLQKIMPDKYTK